MVKYTFVPTKFMNFKFSPIKINQSAIFFIQGLNIVIKINIMKNVHV